MTLIVTALNKKAIWVSTDTQLTASDGNMHTADVPKSGSIKCRDGRFLYSYTGNNVHIADDEFHIADWITNTLSENKLRDTDIRTLIKQLQQQLNERVAYMRSELAELVIVVAGWIESESEVGSVIFQITNCESLHKTTKPNLREFVVIEQKPIREVVAKGSLAKGCNHKFDSKLKYIKKQLKYVDINDSDETIAGLLYDLNTIAHNDPNKGEYIGEKIHITVLTKRSNLVRHINLPKTKDYTSPNVSNEYISVRGIRVKNDLVNGSSIELESRVKKL